MQTGPPTQQQKTKAVTGQLSKRIDAWPRSAFQALLESEPVAIRVVLGGGFKRGSSGHSLNTERVC